MTSTPVTIVREHARGRGARPARTAARSPRSWSSTPTAASKASCTCTTSGARKWCNGVGDSLPFLGALVALLVGLAVGKAWERYKLRDGRWIDRRRARDSHHYVLGPELPGLEPDRPGHRGAEPGHAGRQRRPRDPPDSRQRAPRARPGGARHPGAPGAAAAAQADPGRARVHPVVPGPRLQARRLRRSRARGVQRGGPDGPEQPVRPALPAEAARGAAPVGRCASHPQAAGGAQRTRHAAAQPGHPGVSSRTRSAARRWPSAIAAAPPAISRRPSISTPAPCRRSSTSATCGSCRATSTGAESAWDRLMTSSPERAYLAFDRLEKLYEQLGQPQQVRGALPAADRRQPAGLARAPGPGRPPGQARARRRGVRVPARGARAQSARPDRAPGDLGRVAEAGPRAARWCSATSSRRARRSSSSIRTSA